jgi:hypothetical protein
VSDPDGSDVVFECCGPAEQLTIASLGSATFGGTVKGFDFARGKEKTVTVNGVHCNRKSADLYVQYPY